MLIGYPFNSPTVRFLVIIAHAVWIAIVTPLNQSNEMELIWPSTPSAA